MEVYDVQTRLNRPISYVYYQSLPTEQYILRSWNMDLIRLINKELDKRGLKASYYGDDCTMIIFGKIISTNQCVVNQQK